MRQFFNMDGPVFEALSKLADMMILNLLFIVCSIPVFTIGASLTALACVTLKMKDQEEGYVARTFFRSFKRNFLQATVIWLILFLAGVLLGFDFVILRSMSGVPQLAIQIVVVIGVLIWAMIMLYVFPLLAKFDNSTTATLRNALLLSLANIPRVFLMIIVIAAAVIVTLWSEVTLVYGVLVWLLVGFSFLSWLNSTLQMPVFRKLIPQEEESEEQAEGQTEETEAFERIEDTFKPGV